MIIYKLSMIYFSHWFPGKHKVSAEKNLEAIFELNQSESKLPDEQSENHTYSTIESEFAAQNTAFPLSQPDPAFEGILKSTDGNAFAMNTFQDGKLKSLNDSSIIIKVKAIDLLKKVSR